MANHRTKRYLPLLAVFAFFFSAQQLSAQQEPMYTKYMFNSLVKNPAYAGSLDYLSIRVLHRDQWWGLDGGPMTQSFTIHTPYKKRVGIGLSVANDQIGSSGTTVANGSYAYRIPFGQGNLAIGLQASIMNWRSNWADLRYRNPAANDEVYSDLGFSKWFPNFGAGLYYSTEKYYLGVSVPRLIGFDLRDNDDEINTIDWAKIYRHYYFTAGAAFPLKGDAIVLKPSILIKTVGLLDEYTANLREPKRIGAPAEFDIDLSVLFYQALWVGASFRSAFGADQFGGLSSFDSADIWAAYYLRNGMRIGMSYDYTLSGLQNFTKGTYELMLGYDFVYSTKKVNTPRYF